MGILIILLLIVAGYAYQVYVTPLPKQKIDGDIANANTRDVKNDIMFFYADWCPHCATAKPIWNNFKENNDKKIIGGRMVNCVSVDCTDENNPESNRLIAQYEIQGYPTVKMHKGEDVIDFDAKITKYSLDEFLKNMA